MVNDDPGNKKYADFQNEVNKLQRVNEQPNPNVVKILGSGITETGGFPFIEMEFIEGPDLCELLQPPNDRIFTIKETIKVAEHLAHALSHCHNLDVKHGDIKSNNVKYNRHIGNYVLLDFGLAVMSMNKEEQVSGMQVLLNSWPLNKMKERCFFKQTCTASASSCLNYLPDRCLLNWIPIRKLRGII